MIDMRRIEYNHQFRRLRIRPPVLRSLGPTLRPRLKRCNGSNTADSVLSAAGKIWELQHHFNQREGETISEYKFPERFYREPLPRLEGKPHPPLSEKNVQNIIETYLKIRKEEI